MKSSLRSFITVAETLNISQSAKQLFLTQQCVSGHIKRLESHYGAPLFYRKPRLSLTLAGEILQKTLKKISILENNLEIEMQEVLSGSKGELMFGIHAARSRIVMPNVLAAFAPKFPNVKINIVYGETRQLEKMLLDGKIDMFFGVNARRHDEYVYWHLMDEPLFLIVSNKVLSIYFDSDYRKRLCQSHAVVDLADFVDVPFIFTHSISRTQDIFTEFIVSKDINLKNIITVSDYSLHVSLCARNLGACICPRMMLEQMIRWNGNSDKENRLNAFPVKGLTQTLRLELISHVYAHRPQYFSAFREAFTSELSTYKSPLLDNAYS